MNSDVEFFTTILDYIIKDVEIASRYSDENRVSRPHGTLFKKHQHQLIQLKNKGLDCFDPWGIYKRLHP